LCLIQMKKSYSVFFSMVILVVSLVTVANAAELPDKPKLMVVDQTETFEYAMRVQGLVGEMKNRPEVKVEAKTAKVDFPTENPLKGEEDLSVDVVIIVPHTIETGQVKQIWIVTRPLSSIPLEARPRITQLLEQLKDGIRQAFSGKVEPVGVNDDVIPAYFATLFMKQGVLR